MAAALRHRDPPVRRSPGLQAMKSRSACGRAGLGQRTRPADGDDVARRPGRRSAGGRRYRDRRAPGFELRDAVVNANRQRAMNNSWACRWARKRSVRASPFAYAAQAPAPAGSSRSSTLKQGAVRRAPAIAVTKPEIDRVQGKAREQRLANREFSAAREAATVIVAAAEGVRPRRVSAGPGIAHHRISVAMRCALLYSSPTPLAGALDVRRSLMQGERVHGDVGDGER